MDCNCEKYPPVGEKCETCQQHEQNSALSDLLCDSGMDDRQFRAFLDLLMCSDPYPVQDQGCGTGETDLLRLATTEAKRRKFGSWEIAFHEFKYGNLR